MEGEHKKLDSGPRLGTTNPFHLILVTLLALQNESTVLFCIIITIFFFFWCDLVGQAEIRSMEHEKRTEVGQRRYRGRLRDCSKTLYRSCHMSVKVSLTPD